MYIALPPPNLTLQAILQTVLYAQAGLIGLMLFVIALAYLDRFIDRLRGRSAS